MIKTPGIYYSPAANKIIEIVKYIPVEIVGFDVPKYDVYTEMDYVVLRSEKVFYPSGPLLGLPTSDLKGYYKIGIL